MYTRSATSLLVIVLMATGCAVDAPSPSDSFGTTMSGGPDGGHLRHSLQVQPPDLTSNVDEGQLVIMVGAYSDLEPDLIATMTPERVALHGPDGQAVPFTLAAIPDSDSSIQVVPDEALPDGWYELSVDLQGLPFDALASMHETADGWLASRFRVGSQPVIRDVFFCEGEGKVAVTFSEPLLLPGASDPAEPLAVFADTTQCPILPLPWSQPTLTYYQFACPAETPQRLRVRRTGVLTTGITNANLVRDDPDAGEVSLPYEDAYRTSDCTHWRMP